MAYWMYEDGNSVLESEDGETVIISEEEMKRCHAIGKNWIKTSKEADGEHDKITVAALKALCKVHKLDDTGLKNTHLWTASTLILGTSGSMVSRWP